MTTKLYGVRNNTNTGNSLSECAVMCRGLHVTDVIQFIPELLLWIQVTPCISCIYKCSIYS